MNCRSDVGPSASMPRALLLAALVLAAGTSGCRTTTDDVHRWGNTVQGPRKLASVLLHDKYPMTLRAEAALTLVSMKPRAGRRIGIGSLVETLNQLPAAERGKIVTSLVPRLTAEIVKPPRGSKETREDTSIPYKDAAYALLTNEGGPLVTDPAQAESVRAALTRWVLTDFSNRMDDSAQGYGMEQVVRYLKAPGVRGLPAQIQVDTPKLDRICDLVAELGDAPTRLEASKRLVAVAQEIDSEPWRKSREPRLEAANKASKLSPTREQFQKQLDLYQEEELLRIFGSMRKVGQAPAVQYLVGFAANKAESEKRRTAALAALENHIDKDDPRQIEQIIRLAGEEDTPDAVRDLALRRIGEMPRRLVVDRLYALFDAKNWKVRWLSAELILKMSDVSQVDEFMSHLRNVKHMSLTEPLRYGSLIGEMKKAKVDPIDLIVRYSTSAYEPPVRLSALGYYYEKGTRADLEKVDRYAHDTAKVPGCSKEAQECEWKCTVDEGTQQAEKTVDTIGDFVSYCLEPAMTKRPSVATNPPRNK